MARPAKLTVTSLVLAGALTSVTAKAATTCSVANATPLNLGGYSAGQSGALDSTGEIDVTCTGAAMVRITLGRGNAGHQNPRTMTLRSFSLDYGLYLDAAHTMLWGDGSEGTQIYFSAVGAGQTLRLPVFGRVFAMQAVPPGLYTDRIVVVVTF
jgi:spore coat protein U-like protein